MESMVTYGYGWRFLFLLIDGVSIVWEHTYLVEDLELGTVQNNKLLGFLFSYASVM